MSRIQTWWQATRPFSFPASVIPALLGGLVAVVHAGVRLKVGDYILAAAGAAAVHAAANLLADYFDFRTGVDSVETQGASRGMLVSGRMTPREALLASGLLWLLTGLLAAYFVWRAGAVLLPVIAGGLVIGAGYTAAPLKLKYRALGDACVFLTFGVGITLGAYTVQAGHLAWTPVFYSLPIAVLIWAILHSNNLRDIETDRRARIRTLAMLLGRDRSRRLYVLLLAAAYALVVGFVLAGLYVMPALATLLSLPLAIGAMRQVVDTEATPAAPAAWVTLDIRTAQLQMAFGLLLVVALAGRALF